MELHPISPVITGSEASKTTNTSVEPSSRVRGISRKQRRWSWIAGIAAALLLLLLVPPLVNANRYRRQITRSISESLGRPVHLDNVAMHLLPMPGITLTNLVVDEDPSFGEEPTIRANTVEATLRLGSLWRRRVEFSQIRFVEPSVNLVRNAEGRWNLSQILVNASKLDTAPTVQRKAGPAPRFPYIEATDGRVNIKLGENKLPFSLTDADFALWLPTANQWRVRLQGAPVRTDTNIDEPGTLRVEGILERAATAAGVPVNLHATWHDVPLGGATRFLTGDDLGWRGMLNTDVTIEGLLGNAQLRSQMTLDGLRRAEFSPALPLDLQLSCGAAANLEAVSLRDLQCTLPDSAPTPLTLRTAQVALAHAGEAQVTVSGEQIPLHWGMLWAALFSPRVPTDLLPEGELSVHLAYGTAATPVSLSPPQTRGRHNKTAVIDTVAQQVPVSRSHWSGEIDVAIPAPQDVANGAHSTAVPTEMVWKAQPATGYGNTGAPQAIMFALEPVTLNLGSGMNVSLTGTVGPAGYTVHVDGAANATTLMLPARYLPQLGDGVEDVLPYPPTAASPARVEFTCMRSWTEAQTCSSPHPTPHGKTQGIGATIVPIPQAQPQTPSLLAPRSLSPLDANPALGGPPPPDSAPPAALPHR